MPSLGMTVASRMSLDSSETNDTDPVEDAADELESVPFADDSMVELTRGRPISWKEFIELKPDSSSAELAIIISLIRSMLALCRWFTRCEPELLLVVLLLLLPPG